MFSLFLKYFHFLGSCHPGPSHPQAHTGLPGYRDLQWLHFLFVPETQNYLILILKSIPGVMSSKAIMFTPEKNHTEPEHRLQQRERGEKSLLRRLRAGVLLGTIHPECRPLALPPPGSGTEEAGGWGEAEQEEERSLWQERAVSPEGLV